jgi:DNA-binding transcriptional LysR family regulator
MDLRRLRYFIAVAEELHFGRAAQRLHMSQPPLSLQIQALEQELGVALFLRAGHRTSLSEAGRELLPRARAVLAQAEAAKTAVQRVGRGESGVLELGFTGSLPLTPVMPRVLRDFRAAHPGVQLQLRELSTHEQIERLAQDRLDVGFFRSARHPQLELLETRVVLREPWLVALHADNPLARRKRLPLAALTAEPFILYARSVSTGLHDQILELCLKAGFRPRVVQEVHEMPTVVGLVAAGVGIALVADSMRRIQVPEVVFRPLVERTATADILLAWKRGDAPPVLRNFLAVALGQAGSAPLMGFVAAWLIRPAIERILPIEAPEPSEVGLPSGRAPSRPCNG